MVCGRANLEVPVVPARIGALPPELHRIAERVRERLEYTARLIEVSERAREQAFSLSVFRGGP